MLKKIFAVGVVVSYCFTLKAQENNILGIGDSIPGILFNNVNNYTKSSLGLADFKGKAVIIDFWAPWCLPCLEAMPKLDSLQQKYIKQLQVIQVTSENKNYSQQTLEELCRKKNIHLPPSIMEDTILTNFFKPAEIPHYVWIDAKGIIRAITDATQLSSENIADLTNGRSLRVTLKKDIFVPIGFAPYFSVSDKWRSEDLLFYSVLLRYKPGFPTELTRGKKFNWARCISSIPWMFQLAYGDFRMDYMGDDRFRLENFSYADSLLFQARRSDSTPAFENTYMYELTIPDSIASRENLFAVMRADLRRIFSALYHIDARLDSNRVTYYALVRTSGKDLIKTKGGQIIDQSSQYYLKQQNLRLEAFLNKLKVVSSPQQSFFNETGYRGKADLEINADLTDIAAVNNALKKYGLELVEKQKNMPVLVLFKLR